MQSVIYYALGFAELGSCDNLKVVLLCKENDNVVCFGNHIRFIEKSYNAYVLLILDKIIM